MTIFVRFVDCLQVLLQRLLKSMCGGNVEVILSFLAAILNVNHMSSSCQLHISPMSALYPGWEKVFCMGRFISSQKFRQKLPDFLENTKHKWSYKTYTKTWYSFIQRIQILMVNFIISSTLYFYMCGGLILFCSKVVCFNKDEDCSRINM